MGIEGFDESALAGEFGLEPETATYDSLKEDIRLHPDDKQQIDRVAEQPATGITTPKTAPASTGPVATALPDYLKPYVPQAPATPPAPALEVDYAKRWQEAFGEAPAEGVEVNRDSFEMESVRREAYHQFMQSRPEVADLNKIVKGETPELEMLQETVKTELHAKGLRATRFFDDEMSEYVDAKGQLTDKGTQRVGEIKEQAVRQLDTLRNQANQHVNKSVENLTGFYSTLNDTGKTFKPFGVELEQSTIDEIVDDIRSGRIDEWLDDYSDNKAAAEKLFLLGLVSNPARFAQFVQHIDKRGMNYGMNRGVAQRLNN